MRSKYYTWFQKTCILQWISRSKSRATKSRPRWEAHTRMVLYGSSPHHRGHALMHVCLCKTCSSTWKTCDLWNNQDLWSEITLIIVHQKRNQWIRSKQGFVGSLDVPGTEWSGGSLILIRIIPQRNATICQREIEVCSVIFKCSSAVSNAFLICADKFIYISRARYTTDHGHSVKWSIYS